MNVTNPLLQLLGALQQAPGGSGNAATATQGGDLATLFGELLAAAQAGTAPQGSIAADPALPAGAAPSEAVPKPVLPEVIDDLAAALGVEVAFDGTPVDDEEPGELPEAIAAALAALQAQVKPATPAGGQAPGGVLVSNPGRPVSQAVIAPQADGNAPVVPATAEAEPEARVLPFAPGPAKPEPPPLRPPSATLAAAVAEAFPQAGGREKSQGAVPESARPPEGSPGANVVAAVREAQGLAATEDDGPPGLTIRQLLSEVVGQAQSEEPDPEANANAVRARAVLADLVSADKSQEARSSPLDLAARPAPVGDVRPSGSAMPANGADAHHAHHVRLPESVSVRDVGDFTIRSVRYLSGRTEEAITVRLVPRSLGEMQVAVRSGGDGMEVVVTAATMAARDTIEVHLHGLRDALAREGVDVTRVSVQTFTTSNGGHQAASGQQHGSAAPGQQRFLGSGHGAMPGSPDDPGAMARGGPQHDGGLNMFV